MNRPNETFLNPQIFSTPPPNFNQNMKKRKKPLSQNIPHRKDWSVEDAKRALDVEKDSNKRSKRQSLIIKFPDLELNRDIVSNFHPSIENVHFQLPSTPRYCFVTLKDSADPERVINQLNNIPFGQGHLTAEYKKDREEDLNIDPEDINPLTLYVGNLAREVTKEDIVRCYPKQKRLDIGYAIKTKERYAFVWFKCVEDSIEAFQRTHASQMYSKSLIVRFRRLHCTGIMPGEPKPQLAQRNDTETPASHCLNSSFDRDSVLDSDSAPWDIDVSQWEVDCDKVKQERPESPISDEELDIKPFAQQKARFMPGSLELAFSLHKPKDIMIKSEKLNDSDEPNSVKHCVSDNPHQNKTCEGHPASKVENESSSEPIINDMQRRIKKELIESTDKPTTYSNLRSLNDKIGSNFKRAEQDLVEVKQENTENANQNRKVPSEDKDAKMKQPPLIASDFLSKAEDILSSKNTKLTGSEILTMREKDQDITKNSDSGQIPLQTSENYSNLIRSTFLPRQSSDSQKSDGVALNQNKAYRVKLQESRRELSKNTQTTALTQEMWNSKSSTEQFANQANDNSVHRAKSFSSREHISENKSMMRKINDHSPSTTSKSISSLHQKSGSRVGFTEQQSSKDRNEISQSVNITNEGISDTVNKSVSKNIATSFQSTTKNEDQRNILSSQSTSQTTLKVERNRKQDSPLNQNRTKDDFTGQAKKNIPVSNINRIGLGNVLSSNTSKNTEKHITTNLHEKSETNQEFRKEISVGSNVKHKDRRMNQMLPENLEITPSVNVVSVENPAIQNVFSSKEEAKLRSPNHKKSNDDFHMVEPVSKGSSVRNSAKGKQHFLSADKNTGVVQANERCEVFFKDGDWMPTTTDIETEPVDEVFNRMPLVHRPLLICGPSGSGKNTLLKKMLEEFPDKFGYSVSHTTRKPRLGEVQGIHYHFTDIETMEKGIQEGKFIESPVYSGNMYGTSKTAVEDIARKGKVCILDIEGVKQVKKSGMNPLSIFIIPPSLDELRRRLINRNTETEDSLLKRLTEAKEQMKYGTAPGNFDLILLNDDFETAYSELRQFVITNVFKNQITTNGSNL